MAGYRTDFLHLGGQLSNKISLLSDIHMIVGEIKESGNSCTITKSGNGLFCMCMREENKTSSRKV